MSRSSLDLLDSMARTERVPRDALVEYSIRKLVPIIESEQQRHEQRKVLLREMEDYLRQGRKILNKTEAMLGRDDRIFRMIDEYMQLGEKNVSLLAGLVEKGRAMEDW
jgi:hypothetical protein